MTLLKPPQNWMYKLFVSLFTVALSVVSSESVFAAPVHAYFADEHNIPDGSSTGNRVLEIDLENMELVNSLDVPGISGHHVDNSFNSKVYAVPKGSGFVNVIELRKDQNGSTSMELIKQVDLIHRPRSGDAFNKKFNVVLMAASNRPMGSFIDVETDKVVGTIGENVDCTLTDGSKLLSHLDANTNKGALKYDCVVVDHGGDQVTGHPYWLTPDYAAIVDRTNRQISLYYVWKEGDKLQSKLVNHLKTQTAVHQIVPRDRTSLPKNEQADFYAVEEGKHADPDDFSGGIPHALIHLKLTTNGLRLVRRMNLQRFEVLPKDKAQRILDACKANYRNTDNYRDGRTQAQAYLDLFKAEGISLSPDQDPEADFPIECFYPGIPGGHNADFAPNNKHLYVGMAGGAMSVIDVDRWKIVNNMDVGTKSGPGHTCFSKKHNLALTSNHGASFTRVIRFINGNRPGISQYLPLPFAKEGLTSTYQSHSCYIDENEDFYYNFWTDGGVFYKMDLREIAANKENGNPNLVTASIKTGGIPIQGSYISLSTIQETTSGTLFVVKNDFAKSTGNAITIDVLANDTGDNLVLEHVDGASYGSVSIVNGKIKYIPIKGFSGTDGFWYGVSSPSFDWKWAFVEVDVKSSIPAIAIDAKTDTASTQTDEAIIIDPLVNDIGENLIVNLVDKPSHGTTVLYKGQLVYTPNAGFFGVDEFWYEINDSVGQSAWGKVLLTVKGNQSTLKANNDHATVKLGKSVDINILKNDTGKNFNLFFVDTAWTGTVARKGNKVTYTPSGSYIGDVDFWYGIENSSGNEDWGLVTVTITK